MSNWRSSLIATARGALVIVVVVAMVGCAAPTPAPAPAAPPPAAPTQAPAATEAPAVAATQAPAPTEAPAAPTQAAATQPSTEGVTLRMVIPVGGVVKAVEGGLTDFTKDTGIKADVQSAPIPDVQQQEILDLSSGAGNLDVITTLNQWVGSINPQLEPLDALMQQDNVDPSSFVPGLLDLFKTNGKITALPVRVGGRVLVYRTDLLKEAGIEPPKTYAELKAAAEKLTTPDHYGLLFNLGQDSHMLDSWSTVMLDYGGQFLDDQGKAAFNSKAGVDSLQYILDLYKAKVIPPDAIEMDDSGLITAMQQGRGAMAVAFSGWFGTMIDPKTSKVGDKLAVAPMPYAEGAGFTDQGPSLLSVWALGVSSKGKNKDAAWTLIKYLSDPAVAKKMGVEFANGPTIQSVFTDPDYVKANPAAPDILKALSGGRSQPPIPEWASIATILQQQVSKAIVGDLTPQQALDEAAKQANDLMGK